MLPLDLHVLSLPLAFILSQDQTLHCIISYIFLSLSLTLSILSKESTLLDKLYFSVLASCTVFSLFNELVLPNLRFCVPRFSFGIAKVRFFSLPPNFSQHFFTLFYNFFPAFSQAIDTQHNTKIRNFKIFLAKTYIVGAE